MFGTRVCQTRRPSSRQSCLRIGATGPASGGEQYSPKNSLWGAWCTNHRREKAPKHPTFGFRLENNVFAKWVCLSCPELTPTDFKLPNGRYVVSQRWTLLGGKDWLFFVLQTLRQEKLRPQAQDFLRYSLEALNNSQQTAPLSCATWNFFSLIDSLFSSCICAAAALTVVACRKPTVWSSRDAHRKQPFIQSP